jgi:carboxylate-amine ligase
LVEDSLAIASLYRTLARHLYLNPKHNAHLDAVSRAIVVENKWRAQRYGVHGTFVSEDGAVTVAEFLDGIIEHTMADADALGCTQEIRRCRTIVAAGTSADAQLAVFQAHREQEGREDALRAVTNWIASATLQ